MTVRFINRHTFIVLYYIIKLFGYIFCLNGFKVHAEVRRQSEYRAFFLKFPFFIHTIVSIVNSYNETHNKTRSYDDGDK